jgi:ABC-2 type transport system ATP-binding protein
MEDGVTKFIKCPKCGNIVEITGIPGEKKILTCSECNSKGYFKFPESKEVYGFDVIQVKNLTKRYKDVLAVNNISFNVKKGEIFGFLGPNGAGKTTTIRTLLGYLKPNNGEAYIFGKNVKNNIVEIRKNVGYIPGDLALYEHLTGKQFLDYFSSLRNTDLPLLDELLELFELPLNRKIKTYSKGMKQMMGIVQAFMDDPDVVIMDEPTSGLDPLLQQKFYKFLKNEKKKGRTMFFSSHILSEVDKICDRVGIISKGDLVALESVETLKKKKGKKIRIKFKEKPKELTSMINAKFVDGWLEFVAEDVNFLIKKISKYTILDIEIQEVSLEDIFMRYYSGGEY